MKDAATIDRESLQAVGLFPLPNVVLFPGALLPLHVFEERYVQLAEDVMAGSKLMVVPRLSNSGSTQSGPPPVETTAGLGLIVDSRRLPDNRYNILLRGVGRIAIDEEMTTDRLYRVARVDPLEDDGTERAGWLHEGTQQLVALCDQLSLHVKEGAGELRKLVHGAQTPAALSDLLGSAMVSEPDERQALLAELDVANRIDTLIEHVSRLLMQAGPRTTLPN